ncbi:MAG: cytochrome c [gamma proteobacterium symbiont of Bathyaustriella thionipta]|nr:cytochrome c [gamma proteobacterium symbiont of Bathyaustriella thionipta]MCU7950662.1 cytochrome c [gamma proteobacterium symbiont of Bathyaustriella thionipta]MCU7954719.1 cytochrome c [gamma proteobacterium symbiont of Bathyaustriella thionipta]MCU7957167.1 cytochrome c [gamma proteobacterium symbiont of Bathyaustriella thionipta]MCU7966340.1 cytochrome c [gamma proteobacterium symbiont of Bathyaustriella thionipta]
MKKITISCLISCALLISSTLSFANDASFEAGKSRSTVCIGCHGLQGEGKAPANGQPAFPRIAGQIKDYLIKSVNDYKADKRNDPMMSAIAKGLSDVDIDNIASYYSSLK